MHISFKHVVFWITLYRFIISNIINWKWSKSVDADYAKCLFLALIRRVWIIDFPLMGSDGGESLGKPSMFRL